MPRALERVWQGHVTSFFGKSRPGVQMLHQTGAPQTALGTMQHVSAKTLAILSVSPWVGHEVRNEVELCTLHRRPPSGASVEWLSFRLLVSVAYPLGM